jgi:hypothetical protein
LGKNIIVINVCNGVLELYSWLINEYGSSHVVILAWLRKLSIMIISVKDYRGENQKGDNIAKNNNIPKEIQW